MTVPLEERLRHRGLAARPRSHSQHQEAFLSFSGQAPVLRHSASSLTSDSSTLLSSKGPGALGPPHAQSEPKRSPRLCQDPWPEYQGWGRRGWGLGSGHFPAGARPTSQSQLEDQPAQRSVSTPAPCKCLLCPRPPRPRTEIRQCPGQESGQTRNSSYLLSAP